MVYRPLRYEQIMMAGTAHDVRARRMFGGMGIYSGEKMFALLVGDEVGFKLSPEDVAEALGIPGAALMRNAETGAPLNGYVKMPKSILDDMDRFMLWMERSCSFVRRKAATLH
jgi:DNA transformation protein and related proteins